MPRPSSALDAKASTVCSYRLTCFRFDISQFVLCLQYLKQLDTENVFVLTLPYSIVNVLFLGIKKAAWRFTPSRLPGIHHLWALLYVTVLSIPNIVYSNTSFKPLSIEPLQLFSCIFHRYNYSSYMLFSRYSKLATRCYYSFESPPRFMLYLIHIKIAVSSRL